MLLFGASAVSIGVCAATISLASSCRRCVQEGTVCDVESGAGERQQYAAKSMELDLEPVN
jgi:hypothetical protein